MHHSKNTKEEGTGSGLFILNNFEQARNEPSVRSFVDIVSFVVIIGEDLG